MLKLNFSNKKSAIARSIIALVIVVIIIIAGAGIYFATKPSASATTTTTTSSSSSISSVSTASTSSSPITTSPSITSSSSTGTTTATSTTSSSSTTSATTTSTTSSISTPQVLSIDTAVFPSEDLSPVCCNYPNWFYSDVYQPLIDINDSLIWSTGQVEYVPGLALNWTVSSNGSVYTLNLRQGVNFANGDPFNSYQVWVNFYTMYYMSVNSSGFDLGYPVFYDQMNTTDFGPATLAMLNNTSLANPTGQLLSIMQNSSWPIYVTGPYQIVFRLDNSFEWFPAILVANWQWDMQWEFQHGGPGTPAAPSTYMNTNSAPGTGPYTVTGFSVNSYVKFSQNPTYWGKNLTAAQIQANVLLDPGHVPTVIMYTKSDDIARLTDLESGAVQISDILSADWNAITSNPSTYNYLISPSWSSTAFGIALNTQDYPTNSTALRQAIFHAINYTDLISTALGGEGVVGIAPEYPSFSQFYDLGNLTPYSYNLTEADQILAQNNITTSSLPALSLSAVSGCTWCVNSAQVIQGDLADINLTVNINVVLPSNYYSYAIGPYSSMVNNSAELGNINFVCALTATPDAFTPADAWTTFVSNQSQLCDLAVYSNPVVQQCVNSWFNGTSISQITDLCTQAQKQIYNDAPYVFMVPRLWYVDGSTVWERNGPIANFYMDPEFSGITTEPFINTVTFK